MKEFKEKTIASEIKFDGKFIGLKKDEVILNNGETHFREVVFHPGGVAVVPITNDNKIVMVKQFRYAVGEELIEIPAGKLDPKEDHFNAIKRELQEETGYVAKEWESLGFIYTAPGFCDERLYLYKASNLEFTQVNLDDGEEIETIEITFSEAEEMIKSGKILDAKTIIGLNKVINIIKSGLAQ